MCSGIADERAAVDQLATWLDVAEGGVGALAGGSGGVAFADLVVVIAAAARIVNTLSAAEPQRAERGRLIGFLRGRREWKDRCLTGM